MVVRIKYRVQELRHIDDEKDVCRRLPPDEMLWEAFPIVRGPKKGLTAEANVLAGGTEADPSNAFQRLALAACQNSSSQGHSIVITSARPIEAGRYSRHGKIQSRL
jgi:hypothetical protein